VEEKENETIGLNSTGDGNIIPKPAVQTQWPRPVNPTAVYFLQGIIQQESVRQVGKAERYVG